MSAPIRDGSVRAVEWTRIVSNIPAFFIVLGIMLGLRGVNGAQASVLVLTSLFFLIFVVHFVFKRAEKGALRLWFGTENERGKKFALLVERLNRAMLGCALGTMLISLAGSFFRSRLVTDEWYASVFFSITMFLLVFSLLLGIAVPLVRKFSKTFRGFSDFRSVFVIDRGDQIEVFTDAGSRVGMIPKRPFVFSEAEGPYSLGIARPFRLSQVLVRFKLEKTVKFSGFEPFDSVFCEGMQIEKLKSFFPLTQPLPLKDLKSDRVGIISVASER